MKCPTELKIRSITKHWPLILKSYRQKRGSIYPLATALMKVSVKKSDVLAMINVNFSIGLCCRESDVA